MTREQKIIEEFRKGSKRAFEAIYNEHFASVYHFAKRFIANAQVAEDITTETFLKLWERHENFDNRQSILAFLYITTRNACLNHIRKEQRQLSGQKELLYLQPGETETDFSHHQIAGRIYQHIFNEIEKLPKQLKKVFKLAYIDGLSNEEIAARLRINNQSVRNHKARAMKLLRGALGDKGYFEMLILLTLFLFPD